MLSNKRVLPNFLKAIFFTAAATMSLSAFAEHHGEVKTEIGELKDMKKDMKKHDMSADKKSMLQDDEAEATAADAKSALSEEVKSMAPE